MRLHRVATRPFPDNVYAVKVGDFQRVRIPPGQSVARPEATGTAMEVKNALKDAGIDYSEVEQGFVGYVAGDSTSGNRALYELGMTGIPIVNVNNNCSSGSSALFLPPARRQRGGRVRPRVRVRVDAARRPPLPVG